MSQTYTYTAQSVETRHYITSAKDDKPGEKVATVDGNGGIPDGATLTFDKALDSGNTTDVTIKGINGMYAALSLTKPTIVPIVWSNDAVSWQVDMTSPGVYEIIPKGQDLYWMTNETMNYVGVKSGSGVVDDENKWILKKVE